MNPLLTTPLLALLLSVAVHVLALKFFPRFGLLDFPQRYGLTRGRLPYPVGVVSVVLFAIFFYALASRDIQTTMILLAIILLGIVSFIDDRRQLPAWTRILTQIVCALFVFAGGARIYSITNPLESLLGGGVLPLDRVTLNVPIFGSLPMWSGIFTILWLGLTTNALNWFDGIPGQVSVLSVIGFLTIGFLSVTRVVDQPLVALLAFTLAAIACGSAFVTVPGKAIMGDTGAMFFGFMMGVLTIYAGGKVATGFLVLGVPLFDFAIVLVRRMVKHKPLLKGDAVDEHLHHRLLAKGWTNGQVILLTAAIGASFGFTALFLSTFQKFLAAGILFALMLGLSIYSKPKKRQM